MGNSFRARLALWNVGVLGVVLVGFCQAQRFCVHTGMTQGIDRELAARADRVASGVLEFGSWNDLSGKEVRGELAPVRDPMASLEADVERVAAFRRPRLLNAAGACIDPWGASGPWDPRSVPDALAGRRGYSTIMADGERVRVLSQPLVRDGRVIGAVQVAREMGEFEQVRDRQLRMLMALIPFALLLSGAGALVLTDRGLRPVREVARAAQEIGAGDLSRRLAVTGTDELAQLAATFNGMLARLEEAFRHCEQAYGDLRAAFDQQQRFTADASHELRTPLTRIKVSASLALSGAQPPSAYRKALEIVDEAADQMHRLLHDLLLLARSGAGRLRMRLDALDLREILEQVASAVPPPGRAIILDVRVPSLPVRGEADALNRLFANLLENALRYTPASGRITLSGWTENNEVVLQVADTGEGIPPEHLPHVFERFYRADAARNRDRGGTGLGLSICESIVAAHHGTIAIVSEPGRGTVVTIRLPGDTGEGRG